jgi:hypothetical protein
MIEVGPQPRCQALDELPVHPAFEVAGVARHLAAREILVQNELAWEVSDAAFDLTAPPGRIYAQDGGAAGCGPEKAE